MTTAPDGRGANRVVRCFRNSSFSFVALYDAVEYLVRHLRVQCEQVLRHAIPQRSQYLFLEPDSCIPLPRLLGYNSSVTMVQSTGADQ
jgi:hypothetical protein